MRNSYLVIISCLVSIAVIYMLLFIYTFFNFHNEFKSTFKSLENLNFHEKYSEKIHHIRNERLLDRLWKKPKVEDLLFTTINTLENKEVIVLFQGDSYMEQLTFRESNKNNISTKLVQKFKSKKKVGFINAGIASYSPSLMSLQLDILEEDFKIFPNIIISYIDLTDFEDENCRYKNNKIYENGILKSVKPESYSMYRTVFNYSRIYGLSKISLSDSSKISKTFQLINFKLKYGLKKSGIRFYRKYISNLESDKEKVKKCYGGEILKYLIHDEKTKYFADQVKEYLTKMEQKKHIDKIFLVTFPHKGNFNKILKINVADIIDSIVQDKKNITHINFSKTLLNDKNFNYENIWAADQIHLNKENHGNLFMKKILEELSKYLQ